MREFYRRGHDAYSCEYKENRIKGLGNSIVPQIAGILFMRMKELL
jgi:hypothetical protein